MVEVEARNEPGPALSASLMPSPSFVPSERELVPLPPETEKSVQHRRKRAGA